MKNHKHKVKGFTLVELIVVLATFGIIMFGALQMVQPTRKLFDRSYSNESMTSGALMVGDYLQESLQYAQYVQIQGTDFTDDDRKAFVTQYFDGKLGKDLSASDPGLASGHLYQLHIDNKNHGMISQAVYSYTAGDSNAKTAVEPAISVVSGYTTAVNSAIYDDYYYNVSLGMWNLEKQAGTDYSLLKWNEEFYNYYEGAFHSCGQNNFGFTITAYPARTSKVAYSYTTRELLDPSSGVPPYKYFDATTYTASVSFENMKKSDTLNYIIYDRDETTKEPKVEDGNKKMIYKYNPPTNPYPPTFETKLATGVNPNLVFETS